MATETEKTYGIDASAPPAGGASPRAEVQSGRDPHSKNKSINDTIGAKITHFFIYGLMGFGANSGLSVGITYFLMPKEWVKKPKEILAKSMSKIFKGTESERMRTANGTLEILIMMVAGTILTAAMVPFAKNREKIAHWINQKIGKDTDVLPDSMKPVPEPRTVEEKIEQEINKRTNRRHSPGDVWKARWTALAVPFFGDMALSNWNNKRELAGKESVDTYVWKKGGQFYDNVLSKKRWVDKVSNFFEKHGAGVGDIKMRAPEKFPVLLKTLGEEAEHVNKSKVMIAEQSRMLAKEVGWTIILAVIMERLVGVFHKWRVHKEEKRAIAEITKEGLVPEGYKVVIREGVKLEPITGHKKWTEQARAKTPPSKAESFVSGVETSRADAHQPVVG